MVRHSARGSLILLLGQVSSTLVAAVGTILVARFLGSTSYGQVTIVMIPILIVNLFSNLGVTSSLVKHIAQYRSEGKTPEVRVLVRAGLILTSVSGLLFSILIYLLSGFLANNVFHQPNLKILIGVAAATIFANTLLTVSQSIFVGFERMEFHSLTVIVHSILKSFLAPALVLIGYGAMGAVIGNTVSVIISGILGIVIFGVVFEKKFASSVALLSYQDAFKILLSFGYPLLLSNIFTGGLTQFYNFLTAVYLDPSIIGNYKAAMNFSVLIAFLTMPIATVLFPLFSKIDSSDESSLRLVFQNAVKYAALLTVPVTTIMIILSPQLVRIIYGNSYELAPFILKLFVINSLFVGLGNVTMVNFLNGQGKTKITFLSNLVNLCIGIPLSLILIPRFGVIGLLITIIVAPKPSLLLKLWWIKKNFGFSINWVSSVKIYLSSFIAFLVASYVLTSTGFNDWVDLFVGGGIFLLTYSLLVPLVGALEEIDIQNLRNIVGALGPLAPLFNVFLFLIEKVTRKTNHSSTPEGELE